MQIIVLSAMGQDTDQPYIDRVLSGDLQAFSVLVDRYKHMVLTLALKILGNREEAEEVSQDTFVKIYQVLGTFKGESKFSTWVYKIAYHRSLDYVRGHKRRIETMSLDLCPPTQDSTFGDILDDLEARDKSAIIDTALKQLSAEDGILITLHYYEGLTLKEVGEITNMAPNTVKVRLFRTRKRLAELLRDRVQPENTYRYGAK
ncbi:MAG: RNA polymerase sigma factor [Sediminicola sp.]